MNQYCIMDSCENCKHCVIQINAYEDSFYCNVDNDMVLWRQELGKELLAERLERQASNEQSFKWKEKHRVEKNGKCIQYEKESQ